MSIERIYIPFNIQKLKDALAKAIERYQRCTLAYQKWYIWFYEIQPLTLQIQGLEKEFEENKNGSTNS